MPVITSNPRYERLAQCLAAGMRQSDIARELDFNEFYLSELKQTEVIQLRLKELLEDRASRLSESDCIATVEERKQFLTKVIRSKAGLPPMAGDQIRATKELNLMEKVYTQGNQAAPMVAIQVVLPSAQSTQLVPGQAEIVQLEAKNESITNIVKSLTPSQKSELLQLLQSAQSAQSLPEPSKLVESEAK